MTIKQAIERLHNLQSLEEDNITACIGVWYKGIKDDYDEALDMAIEALSELDNNSTKVDNENVDLITKQSALDMIHKTIYGFFDISDDDSEEPISDKDKLLLEINKAICNGIKDLPSARPESFEWCRDH